MGLLFPHRQAVVPTGQDHIRMSLQQVPLEDRALSPAQTEGLHIDLEDTESISLWSQGTICLLQLHIKKIKQKKNLGSLISGLLSCNGGHCTCMCHLILSASSQGAGTQRTGTRKCCGSGFCEALGSSALRLDAGAARPQPSSSREPVAGSCTTSYLPSFGHKHGG